MKVLVCGGRDYNRTAFVFAVLDLLRAEHPTLETCHGNARGADTLAAMWATSRKVPQTAFPARWELHGRQAGAVRNAEMLREFCPDLVLAFPGGPGTKDMVRQARKASVTVREVRSDCAGAECGACDVCRFR